MRKTIVLVCLLLGASATLARMVPVSGNRPIALNDHEDLSRKAFISEGGSDQLILEDSPSRLDPVYDYETVVVGTSAYDYQHNGSYGKMIAIGADGVAHGSFMGGANETTGRRVLSWCVATNLTIPNPAGNVANVQSGYATIAVSSAAPANNLPDDTGVTGYHRSGASWFAMDFGECSMAFLGLQHLNGATILWPHITIDYQDKVHMVCGDSAPAGNIYEDAVWYDASTSGNSWDAAYNLVSDNCNTLGHTLTANKNGPGVAMFFLPDAPASPAIYPTQASQWHHDVVYYEASDAGNNLHAVLNADLPPINLTQYNSPACPAPFRFGVYAYTDVDAIYDSQETPNLHIAFPTPVSHPDSMLYVVDDTLFFNETVEVDAHSAIWHCNTGTGEWGHIGGWLTGDSEADELPAAFAGVFRTKEDRVQLAHDPATGYLYALWNVYDKEDLRSPGTDGKAMANGELYMACSADNGLTWGPRVNITDSPSPGCESPDCFSETFGSLAEIVTDGYLHLSFMMDQHAGSYIRTADTNDGSLRTVNNYYYMRIPVSAVPPHTGLAWDAAGHIGLGKYSRNWYFTNGHLDTVQIVDNVAIFNEGRESRRLVSLVMYHDALDQFGDSSSDLWVEWGFMTGDPVEPGGWIPNAPSPAEWDGILPAQRVTLARVAVGHRGLPLREQAFKFTFDDGTERVYRYKYQGPNGVGSLVAEMDLNNLEQYASVMLYGETLPAPVITASMPFNNNFVISWEPVAQATHYRVWTSPEYGGAWSLLATTTDAFYSVNAITNSTRIYRVTALIQN